jgi:hypothetical protein
MRLRPLAVAAAAVAAVSVGLVLSARAEDPSEGMPPPQKKIDQPFLTSEVGDWKVSWKMYSEQGEMAGTSTSKFALAAGGTLLVEDYAAPEMMGGFHGHGVLKVSDDGKSVTIWWFDTTSPEPMKLTGPLGTDSATMEGTMQMGPYSAKLKIVWKKVDGGFDFIGTMDGKPWLDQQYRR